MNTGTKVSLAGHGALILLALFGLPWFGPDEERAPIRVTDVSFVSEAEFDAAQAAAPADVPREPEAPAVQPAPRPPEPAEAAPEPVAEAPAEVEVSAVEPPAEPEAPEVPDRIVPKVVTLEPPTAASPPRPRPAPRVSPEPTPTPPEAVRPAELPRPVTAPEPEPDVEVARVEEPPTAPPEAAPEPEAEAAPRAPLALATSGRPEPRRTSVERRDDASDTVMAALKREVAREQARRQSEAEATPATPATEPSVTEPTAAAPAQATSLPVGPPLSNSEKEGLKLAVQRCWNMPAGLRDAQELKVMLAAELQPNGQVINASIRLIEPSPAPDGRFQQAYEAGRRALIRCSPYELPRDKYAQWRNIEVVFNPEGMVSW
jgi:hypothetical protein